MAKNKDQEVEIDPTFLKDLSYDDCGLMSLNHLLVVN